MKENARAWLAAKNEHFLACSIALEAQDHSIFSPSLLSLQTISPRTWWRSAHLDAPEKISAEFLELVDDLLSLPSSTAGIERCFSSLKSVLSENRSRLDVLKATKLCFINRHLK
jgi:hypothetical protein